MDIFNNLHVTYLNNEDKKNIVYAILSMIFVEIEHENTFSLTL